MSAIQRSVATGKILVTGGTGYIGSHACVELLAAGFEVVILDNLANSSASVVGRIKQIAGGSENGADRTDRSERSTHRSESSTTRGERRDSVSERMVGGRDGRTDRSAGGKEHSTSQRVEFVQGDVRDRAALDGIFSRLRIAAVMHFAGLKAVGESEAEPLAYYDNNVHGSVVLAQAMAAHGVRTLVFSSSATVYGEPSEEPIGEDFPLRPANTYGRTKLMVEQMLRDLAASQPGWRIALLRYFNPVGAHSSGLIGEDPRGVPNNLVPYVSQVAAGRLERLSVYGNDYPTPDGTGVRDYIHVVDLALGHVAALRYLKAHEGVLTVNLGTGRGYSVLEVVRAYERASGRTIPYEVVPRRLGDIAIYFADPSLAAERLGWRAERDLDAMCRDAWRWQQWQAANLT